MYLQFSENETLHCITLQPETEFFAAGLPRAEALFPALAALLGADCLRLSDLLPENFLYKPLSFDCMTVQNDEDYRLLKQIKAAAYLQKQLFHSCPTGDALLAAFRQGRAVMTEDRIHAPDCSPMLPRREIHPEFSAPVVCRFSTALRFHLYIGTEAAENLSGLTTLTVGQYRFTVCGEQTILHTEQPNACRVLQAAYRTQPEFCVGRNDRSAFRYVLTEKGQYFRAGSVFSPADRLDCARQQCLYPFYCTMEDKL